MPPREFYAEKVPKKTKNQDTAERGDVLEGSRSCDYLTLCRRGGGRGGKMGRNTGKGGEGEGKKGRRGGKRVIKGEGADDGVLLPVWLLLGPEFLSENTG